MNTIMNEKIDNFIFVIFGGSGDLTKRKLVPALFSLFNQNLLPQKFAILGLGRKDYDDKSYRTLMETSITEFSRIKNVDTGQKEAFVKNVYYQKFDMSQDSEYEVLEKRLKAMDKDLEIGGNFLYYLATPPEFFAPISENLGKRQLNKNNQNWKRIILEKPIGHDLKSAQKLNQQVLNIFDEEQIYRIDHYLGKETVQNILAFRFANGIFEPLWNRRYIHHIEITAAESIGVEDRGGYYDGSGALRDMVQNHLLQVAATVAMEPPSRFEDKWVRDEKVKVFDSLRPIIGDDVAKYVIRGQYISAGIKGKKVLGYRQEKNVDPNSQTETFVALKFYIDNWRWGGVPFYIRTGKYLPTRATEIVIHYNKTPHHMFRNGNNNNAADNQLILRVQPDEGILLKFGMKVPGAGFNIKNVGMDFHYSDLADSHIPEAYERLILDALLGDSTLYARADAVEQAWKFIDPILNAWKSDPSIKLYGYPAGSWGPQESRQLFDDTMEDWRYPCKNLTGDETYCEL
jgi:glucose-6-phosphate 1-dehydrogenase